MDREQAKEFIKGQLEQYLQRKGIDTRKPFRCLNPEHADKNPSMNYDGKRNRVHCFGCRATYDTFDLIGIDYGMQDFKGQFERACELFHIDVDGSYSSGLAHTSQTVKPVVSKKETTTPASKTAEPQADCTDYFQTAHSHIKETDYPTRRGLSSAIIDRFRLGYDPAWRHPKAPAAVLTSPRLIIPTSKCSYIARDVRNTLTDKEKQYSKSKVGTVHLFNVAALDRDEPVFIVEGEIDAMSVEELGKPAVALGSTSMVRKFLEYMKGRKVPLSLPLIIAMDADDSGNKAAQELSGGLTAMGIPSYRPDGLYTAGKDANDNLLHDRDNFRERLDEAQCNAVNKEYEERKKNKKKYRAISAAAYLTTFADTIREKANTPSITTGFTKLDTALDGGLYEGLYIIGAISSLGKTTFVLQTADQLARSGQDVLIFSLEMAQLELIAKSISRLTFEHVAVNNGNRRLAKTARGITDGKRWKNYNQAERHLIDKAITSYKQYADHLFIFEGVGNIGVETIREAVQRHITITGHKPVVVVDYLQILAPYNDRATDKMNTDHAVTELKRISRDYKIPVLAISSFNRQNYTAKVDMQSFKESGAIEYSSDVLIGLQLEGAGGENFDATAAKREDPRHIELVILKNRNGRVGDEIFYDYFPMFNFFHERDSSSRKKKQRPI